MRKVIFFTVLIVLLTRPIRADEAETKVTGVTYGSVVKLIHLATGHRLHSHDIPYGTGSGQQSVTAFHSSGDANSYWLVKGEHDSSAMVGGTIVRCGDIIRLQHLRTSKNLHSHNHRAPLSRDYEVSAYRIGEGSGLVNGDIADNWKLECARGKKEWGRVDEIRLMHQETGNYLSSNAAHQFNDPIPQQLQVSGSSRRNANTVWKTDEGFFLAPEKK